MEIMCCALYRNHNKLNSKQTNFKFCRALQVCLKLLFLSGPFKVASNFLA